MITHKEINNSAGVRSLYTPPDLGLKWSDAKNILTESKDVVFETCSIINPIHYDFKSFQGGNKSESESFWELVKK